MKTPDYMNYSRYKKNKKQNKKKSTYMFIATFCVTLFIFVGMAKILSPDVDINLGNDTDYEAKDTGLGVKKFIDNRLKMIQNDDNGQSSVETNQPQGEKSYNDASFDRYSTTQMNVKVKMSPSARNNTDYSITDEHNDMNGDMGITQQSQPQTYRR